MTGYPDLKGRRVTVIGLGIEGVDLVRFLAARGAEVIASDAKTGDRLTSRLRQIEGLPVRLSLGANAVADVAEADIVFVSQGVPLGIPALEAARQRGIPVSSMTRLFLELCPGPVVGITGSSGKTTTASLVGAMFEASGRQHVVGGNIGVGLLGLLEEITAETWVVLEISHTQLELTERSPHVACVLNVTPNHLDQFSWPDYVALKRNLLRHQGPDDWAVLNYDNAETRAMASQAAGGVAFFSGRGPVPGDGAFLRDGTIVWRREGRETPVLAAADIALRGDHNIENVAAATAVASLCDIEAGAIAGAVRDFRPAPHRLELVEQIDGVAYYNDSIATTPERALAGLRSFGEPVVLLLGGREKHLPLAELASEACRRCRAVIVFGEAAPLLEDAFRAGGDRQGGCNAPIRRLATLTEAVEAARAEARRGDVVLLSPACASFDAYANFEERGEDFRRIVRLMRESQGGQTP